MTCGWLLSGMWREEPYKFSFMHHRPWWACVRGLIVVVAAFTFKQRKDRNQANTVSVKLDDFFFVELNI